MSAFGDLAYPPDFQHFSYVDPNAPKGGLFSQIGPDRQFNQNFLTFNSLNSYILKGDAAQGMELTFATLMVRSGDEPDAMYGLAAEKVRRSADGLTYEFFIRPQAKFHDGSPLTAHDVAFSLNTLKEKGHPIISPVAARLQRRQGKRRSQHHRNIRAETCARCSAAGCRTADIFPHLLRIEAVRSIDPRRAARLRRLQGRPLRARPFHRICARQGLVGRRSSGSARPEQFRRRALRILPRSRRRLRRLYRAELSVPRGIHLAHLGDALRFSGDQGRQGQARHDSRRHAIRRARLVHQYPAAEILRSEAPRSADRCFRFRMDQQDDHVRLVRAHRLGFPEFRHDGERSTERRRSRTA